MPPDSFNIFIFDFRKLRISKFFNHINAIMLPGFFINHTVFIVLWKFSINKSNAFCKRFRLSSGKIAYTGYSAISNSNINLCRLNTKNYTKLRSNML